MATGGIVERLRAADRAFRRPRGAAARREAREIPELDRADSGTTAQVSESTSELEAGGSMQDKRRLSSSHYALSQARLLRFRIFQVVMLGLFMAFVFLLPVWSWLLKDVFGEATRLCFLPASEVVCGDGRNYTQIAMELGRVGRRGELIGCGCGEGALADWACPPAGDGRFSISYFISTAPGTGAMAAFSLWPILTQWIHGVGNAEFICEHCSRPTAPSSLAYAVMWYSQFAFHAFYGLFLINTLCVQTTAHFVVVLLFIVALLVHFATLSLALGIRTREGKIILGLAVTGVVCVVTGFLIPGGSSLFSQYAFWLGECIGLSCAFAVMPVLGLFLV